MSFVIHLHLGNVTEAAPAGHANEARAHHPQSQRWRSRRWTSHREYEEHLRRVLRSLAGAGGLSDAGEPADDAIPLADEDLCELADGASSGSAANGAGR